MIQPALYHPRLQLEIMVYDKNRIPPTEGDLYLEALELYYKTLCVAGPIFIPPPLDNIRREARIRMRKIVSAEYEHGPRCPECSGPMTEWPWGKPNISTGPMAWSCPRCVAAFTDPHTRVETIPAEDFPTCPRCPDRLQPGDGHRIWWTCPTDKTH